jgi:hypothetical protein
LTESEINDTANSFDPVPKSFVIDAIRKTDPEFRISLGNSVGTLNGIQDEVIAVNQNKDRVTLIVNKNDSLVNADYYSQFTPSICYQVDEQTHSPHHLENWLLPVIEEIIPY